MSNIRKQQLVETLNHLPEMEVFDPVADTIDGDDIFLCTLGFEPRCMEIPAKLRSSGYRAKRAVVIRYASNRTDNEINLSNLEEHLNAITESVNWIEEDSGTFLQQFVSLISKFRVEHPTRRPTVTFDVSVAANRLVVKCLNALLESDVQLRIVYSEAAIYYPTFEEYEEDKRQAETEPNCVLERGVSNIVFSDDHPGNHLDPLPDSLIIFPTFNGERSWAAINRVDPSLVTSPGSKVVWLIGVPHLPEDQWRKEATIELNNITPEMKQYDVSTFDYKETLQTLERIHEGMWEEYNISLLPLGSKLQAIGVSLFCYLHRDVRLMYAIPKEYNATRYSDGCKALWKIDFGWMKEMREKLDSVGKLSIIQ